MGDHDHTSSRLARQILENEGLPSDLLQQISGLPETQERPLFEWVAQLRKVLSEDGKTSVEDVLNDGVLISVASSEAIGRDASTLDEGVRSSLKEIWSGESSLKEQAAYVLAMDVQNRVHNRLQQEGPSEGSYARDDN